jgi:hypothetical protein
MNAYDPIRARLGLPRRALLGLLILPSCLSLSAPPPAVAAETPLSPSEYAVSPLCGAPTPGYSGCLGLRLVPHDPVSVPDTRELPAGSGGASSSSSPAVEHTVPAKGSLSPANLLSAYGLTGISPPSTQTIALVDAYDDTSAEADLAVFDSKYGLAACTKGNGCFRKVNEEGNPSPLPASGGTLERGWAQEIATDVEVAHGVCPSCDIVLVEARSNANNDLYAAEQTAAGLGVNEISNSWGGEEPPIDSQDFNHPGIVITASSGDDGYLNWLEEGAPETANYPASSPHVVAVGGTSLLLGGNATKTWKSESVWNDGGEKAGVLEGFGAGGGGCSEVFTAPVWQQLVSDWASVGCGSNRAVADVSADADPYTGVSVYDSTEYKGEKGWAVIGGTSVASPIIASVFALVGGAQGVEYPARTLYENELRTPTALHDVTAGSNGECLKPFKENSGTSGCTTAEEAKTCSGRASCVAGVGYDGPTGVGTPHGIVAFESTGVAPATEEAATAEPVSEAQPVAGVSAPIVSRPFTPTVRTPTLSALSLTHRAVLALNHRRPKMSKLAFSFTLSTPARVRVTISRRVRVHGHLLWKAVSKPFTIVASGGSQSHSLSGRGTLASGRYRLMLAPARGAPKSIVFQIG